VRRPRPQGASTGVSSGPGAAAATGPNAQNQNRTPPPNYVCFRCGQRGMVYCIRDQNNRKLTIHRAFHLCVSHNW
jgi:hypothetical protein